MIFNMAGNKLIHKLIKTQNSNSTDIKILPHSIEAEQSVLGGLMLDNERWDDISELVVVEDFFNYSHQLIFLEMQKLIKNNQPIDLITLSESLEICNKLEKVGGFAYLAELAKNTPNVSNINAYTKIVRERAISRKIILIGNKIINAGYNLEGKNSEELLDFAESSIFNISQSYIKKNKGPRNIEQLLDNTITRIELLHKKPCNGVTGIDTGYKELNKKTAGLQKSDLIIIASRPSMGKTTFAMNLCENVAMLHDKPVLIFSLEMHSEQIVMRMLASLSRVDQTNIRTGQLNSRDWERIASTIGILLEKKNIYIDDSSRLMPNEIRSRARRIYRENDGLSMIMIDYLQLIHIPSLSENRTQEISEISRALKSLAKELNIPIIALSQLNRSLEHRSDKRPLNADLRESGSIEQDADLIMFIYRDEIYNENSDLKGIAEIILGKQRNGPIGTIRLTFNGQWSRFDNYAGSAYDD